MDTVKSIESLQAIPGEMVQTLSDVLRKELTELASDGLEALQHELQAATQDVKAIPTAVGERLMKQVVAKAMTKLDALLAIDLRREIIARAWAKFPDLMEYRDAKKYPPDKTYRAINLLEQTIKSKYEPSVKPVIYIMGRTLELEVLAFPIALEVGMKGGEIHIKAGHILGVSIGHCTLDAQVSLKYGESFERKLIHHKARLDFEQGVRFPSPVPIGG